MKVKNKNLAKTTFNAQILRLRGVLAKQHMLMEPAPHQRGAQTNASILRANEYINT